MDVDEYDPDLVPTREFKILHSLTTNPDASVADAVQQVLDMTKEEVFSKDDTSENSFRSSVAYDVSALVADIAMNTAPPQQAKLLDFVYQIRKVTVTDPRTGERVRCGSFGHLWTDLHSIGMHVADHLRSIIPSDSNTKREVEKWENITAFVAQSTAAAIITYNGQPTYSMDFSIYALFASRDAFEEKIQYKTAVRIACVWFIYAAGSILENCKIGRVYNHHNPPKRGFDMGRWHSWKLGLVFTRAGSGDESTQKLIRRALDKIAQAEVERLD